MQDVLILYYAWIKAFHMIAVIAWMAGMLYLPRLFFYHCETVPGSTDAERFKRMELRLLRIIINPSMMAVWLLGLVLVYTAGVWDETWFQVKFVLVLALSGLHGFFSRCRKDFARDANKRTPGFYRMVNEIPALLMIVIVILAVVKPF